ncbi:hypothetical protein DL764_009380 [Monosporascus ibericus]|uniref:Uncharacterized protein n=1 Tax=Monosporascus ibericus TaxID=155417 RepID=A0A4Q4SXW8_9PEZI|nr:hypothetical protein DL764_009380 [Monosporascus ibericus]
MLKHNIHPGAKQKERIRALERMVVSAMASGNANTALNQHAGPDTQEVVRSKEASINLRPSASGVNVGPANAPEFSILFSFANEELVKCLRVMAREGFGFRNLVKYGLIGLGYAMEPSLFDHALLIPTKRWIELVKSNYGGLDMKQVVSCGVRILSQLKNPPEWPSLDSYKAPCPNPSTRNITLTTMSIISAQLLNMQHLNITPVLMLDEDAQSLYCLSNVWDSGTEGVPNDENGSLRHISPDLRPVVAQRTLPHHPYIDLIPWPSFRSNVIQATSVDPPTIDEDDLCLDLSNGGIRCWGSTMGSMHGRGEGVPWDSRSWEAMPWFLEKWQLLTGGEDSEISRTSAWWRSMQGMN